MSVFSLVLSHRSHENVCIVPLTPPARGYEETGTIMLALPYRLHEIYALLRILLAPIEAECPDTAHLLIRVYLSTCYVPLCTRSMGLPAYLVVERSVYPYSLYSTEMLQHEYCECARVLHARRTLYRLFLQQQLGRGTTSIVPHFYQTYLLSSGPPDLIRG